MENRQEETFSQNDLVTEFGPMVSAVCRRMISDPELAKDAAQEVWLQVMRGLGGFAGRSKISTWIFAITRRVVLHMARREKLYSLQFLRDYFHGDALTTDSIADQEKKIWVQEMFDKCLTGILHCLDNETRLSYILRDMAQLPFSEVARIMERDEAGVRKRISRARRRLKSFLTDECSLHNPAGPCRCRMRNLVKEINLPAEFQKVRRIVARVNVFLESEAVLPKKNFWEKMI